MAAAGQSHFECTLQGTIFDGAHEQVVGRLAGLCAASAEFREAEFCFKSAEVMRQRTRGGERGADTLFVRADVEVVDGLASFSNWVLRHHGGYLPDLDATVERILESRVSDNILAFLVEMGYSCSYEYLREGRRFSTQFAHDVSVSKIYSVGHVHGDCSTPVPLKPEPVVDGVWLVELLGVVREKPEGMIADMETFVKYLDPLVMLDIVDHRDFEANSKQVQLAEHMAKRVFGSDLSGTKQMCRASGARITLSRTQAENDGVASTPVQYTVLLEGPPEAIHIANQLIQKALEGLRSYRNAR